MADLVNNYSTSKFDDSQLGEIVESMIRSAKDSRRNFERKWYDNNYFDDGAHFRSLSKSQNKIIDLSERASLWAPMRAIPKASRQIRGMVNLLVSQDYVPVVYPEKINTSAFRQQMLDPQTGQPVNQMSPEYQKAIDEAKKVAESSGHWIEETFKDLEIKEQKLPHMAILTAKHGISYLKIWPDPIDEEIDATVRDAFDVYVMGSMTELKDCPFVGEGVPRSIAEIKADERFDPEQVKQISPENKHASSEIKEAYMRTQYGGEFNQAEHSATLIQKEFYIKEYLNDENVKRIRKQNKGEDILRRHTNSNGELRYGNPVFRQVFTAGNIPLRSEYVNLPDYPYVDLRLEPGPLYQVPLIERFIPANKSLDMVVSRVERFTHTMVTGSWSIKNGEPAEPNNSAGGQILKYNTTPPVQNQIASVPPFVFNFMGLLSSFMEEQGVTLSTLGKLPQGVKAASAIESLKESEYANLVVATKQLKKTVKRIAEKMLDIADDYFVSPQTVYYLEKGEPQYFDVIGATGLKKRQEIGLTSDLSGDEVALKKDYMVEIEVQSGLGYTKEGKKAAAKELGDYMLQMAQQGLVPQEAIKVFMETLLREYEFGPTKDIMEAMKAGMESGGLEEENIDQMKVAILEVFKDLIKQGILPDQDTRIQEGKIAMAEAAKDTGLLDKEPKVDPKTEMELAKGEQEMKIKEEEHQMKMAQGTQDMQIKKVEKAHGLAMSERTTEENLKIAKSMAKQGNTKDKKDKDGK